MVEESVVEAFTRIHDTNAWGGTESVSGGGSSLEATAPIRAKLRDLLIQHRVLTFLDLPCGDFNWMNRVIRDMPGLRYTGGDVVPALIEKNRVRYPGVRFEVLDITSSPLQQYDMIFCRDCLVHLPGDLIAQAIDNVRRSESLFFVATTFPKAIPQEIQVGQWRPINLIPFLGEPQQVISEGFHDLDGVQTEKQLGLWRLR